MCDDKQQTETFTSAELTLSYTECPETVGPQYQLVTSYKNVSGHDFLMELRAFQSQVETWKLFLIYTNAILHQMKLKGAFSNWNLVFNIFLNFIKILLVYRYGQNKLL